MEPAPVVCESQYHMPYCLDIDRFQVGDLISKCCAPYDVKKPGLSLNNVQRVRHKKYDSYGRLLYVIVGKDGIVDSATHLGPRYFSGWINRALLIEAHAARPVGEKISYTCQTESLFLHS